MLAETEKDSDEGNDVFTEVEDGQLSEDVSEEGSGNDDVKLASKLIAALSLEDDPEEVSEPLAEVSGDDR